MSINDYFIETLDRVDFGLLKYDEIQQEFLTVVGEEQKDQIREQISILGAIVFYEQQKTSRGKLRFYMDDIRFKLTRTELKTQYRYIYEVMK